MAQVNSTQNVTTTASVIGSLDYNTHLSVLNPTGSGATIYIGFANVTPTNATFVLAAGDPPWIADTGGEHDPSAGFAWYFVTASGTATGVCIAEAA